MVPIDASAVLGKSRKSRSAAIIENGNATGIRSAPYQARTKTVYRMMGNTVITTRSPRADGGCVIESRSRKRAPTVASVQHSASPFNLKNEARRFFKSVQHRRDVDHGRAAEDVHEPFPCGVLITAALPAGCAAQEREALQAIPPAERRDDRQRGIYRGLECTGMRCAVIAHHAKMNGRGAGHRRP